jgi:hypothetical protein
VIRIGFIGTSNISGRHFAAPTKLRDKAQVVAVCDLSEARACAAAEPLGAGAVKESSGRTAGARRAAAIPPPVAGGQARPDLAPDGAVEARRGRIGPERVHQVDPGVERRPPQKLVIGARRRYARCSSSRSTIAAASARGMKGRAPSPIRPARASPTP